MDLDRILKPNEIIDRLKYAEKQCVKGYYYILIRPDVRDRIVELLKEQEAVEPTNSYGTFRCGNCRNIVGYNDGHGRGYQNNFCSKCGQAVKWE